MQIKLFMVMAFAFIAKGSLAMNERKLAWFATIPELAERCANLSSQGLFPSPEQRACERRSRVLAREALFETEERKSAKKDILTLFPDKTPEERDNIFRQHEAQRAFGIKHHEEIKCMHGLVMHFEEVSKD